MKKYIKPALITFEVELTTNLLGASRVQTGGAVGNEYTGSDVSYSKENSNMNIWDDDDE